MAKAKWFDGGDVVVMAISEYSIGSVDKGYKHHKDILSKIVLFKDYENPDAHILSGMRLYHELCSTYQTWCDGSVTVSITIQDQTVNM
tara:strand:- start:1328 stop:1591 length:264 start_codon:yes stop_codon:yes gene_type:complete